MQNIKKNTKNKIPAKISKKKNYNKMNLDKPFNIGSSNLTNQSNKIKVGCDCDYESDDKSLNNEKSDPSFVPAQPVNHKPSKKKLILHVK